MIETKDRINRMLFAMLGSWEFVDSWWKSSNVSFNFSTPYEVYEQQDGPDKVFKYVAGHCDHNI